MHFLMLFMLWMGAPVEPIDPVLRWSATPRAPVGTIVIPVESPHAHQSR